MDPQSQNKPTFSKMKKKTHRNSARTTWNAVALDTFWNQRDMKNIKKAPWCSSAASTWPNASGVKTSELSDNSSPIYESMKIVSFVLVGASNGVWNRSKRKSLRDCYNLISGYPPLVSSFPANDGTRLTILWSRKFDDCLIAVEIAEIWK